MVSVTAVMFIDAIKIGSIYSSRTIYHTIYGDMMILLVDFLFCIVVCLINVSIALYGMVCGCCYSKEFEPILNHQVDDIMSQTKSAFSFTTSNKVRKLQHLTTADCFFRHIHFSRHPQRPLCHSTRAPYSMLRFGRFYHFSSKTN